MHVEFILTEAAAWVVQFIFHILFAYALPANCLHVSPDWHVNNIKVSAVLIDFIAENNIFLNKPGACTEHNDKNKEMFNFCLIH